MKVWILQRVRPNKSWLTWLKLWLNETGGLYSVWRINAIAKTGKPKRAKIKSYVAM